MGVLCPNVKWQFALVYLDDAAICLQTPKTHQSCQRKVFSIRRSGYDTNLEKLKNPSFFTNCIAYLRHGICSGRLNVTKRIIYAIFGLEYRAELTERRSVLGWWIVLRRLVLHFGREASPLSKKLQSGAHNTFKKFPDEEISMLGMLKTELVAPQYWHSSICKMAIV